MPMRKIAIALSKGGVAKSTSCINLAHGLALKGKRVLIVDTDDQGQDAFLLGVKPQQGLAEVLQERCDADQAMLEVRNNLWLMAGGKALAAAKRDIGKKDFGAEHTLTTALKPLEGKFDYVIIDTSPSWDTLTINSLFYCEEVISPVSCEVLTLNALVEFSKRLESVKQYNTKLQYSHIIPTFLDLRVKKSGEILEQLKKYYKEKVSDPVRYNVKLSECAGFGKTIFEFAPSSPGAKDYQKIVERILSA
jgi:chromosome partitioning protein